MKSNTQNTSEEIKKKHKELLIQLKKFNEILEEIKLANNNTQAITTACEILKITNISDENFLKHPNKNKKEIRDRLKELGQYSPIAKEKYKHFTHIWSNSIKQKLQNPSLQKNQEDKTNELTDITKKPQKVLVKNQEIRNEKILSLRNLVKWSRDLTKKWRNSSPKKDQKNETPKGIKLINHNTQATIGAYNIYDKASLGISHENIYTPINELRADSSCNEMKIKRNHFVDLYFLSGTFVIKNPKKVLVKNQDISNELRNLFERGIPDYKLNFVIHPSIITLNQYDYSCNNSLKDIQLYLKDISKGINTGTANTQLDNKITEFPITKHNSALHNQLTTPLENRSDKKSSSVTYTHTQKDSKIKKV